MPRDDDRLPQEGEANADESEYQALAEMPTYEQMMAERSGESAEADFTVAESEANHIETREERSAKIYQRCKKSFESLERFGITDATSFEKVVPIFRRNFRDPQTRTIAEELGITRGDINALWGDGDEISEGGRTLFEAAIYQNRWIPATNFESSQLHREYFDMPKINPEESWQDGATIGEVEITETIGRYILQDDMLDENMKGELMSAICHQVKKQDDLLSVIMDFNNQGMDVREKVISEMMKDDEAYSVKAQLKERMLEKIQNESVGFAMATPEMRIVAQAVLDPDDRTAMQQQLDRQLIDAEECGDPRGMEYCFYRLAGGKIADEDDGAFMRGRLPSFNYGSPDECYVKPFKHYANYMRQRV